jgi:hypothetical protein
VQIIYIFTSKLDCTKKDDHIGKYCEQKIHNNKKKRMWLSVFICHCYYPSIKEEAYISIYECAR